MCRMSTDVQYEQGTFSVEMRMCSANRTHHQYEGECAVRARNIIRSNEDVQNERGTSSDGMRMCSTREEHHQYE